MRPRYAFQLLDSMVTYKCADARDRIYAIRGMVSSRELEMLGEPDYLETWQSVYISFCKKHIERYSNLTFLSLATNDGDNVGLPTWVPDWSSSENKQRAPQGFAGSHFESAVKSVDKQRLVLRGKSVAVVEVSKPTGIESKTTRKNLLKLADALRSMLLGNPLSVVGQTYSSYNKLVATLIRVLSLSTCREAFTPTNLVRPSYQDIHCKVDTLLTDETSSSQLNDGLAWYFSGCINRSLLITKDGRLGLGPGCTRAGDIVSTFLGCDLPMILRPIGNNYHQVVGPAYVDGIMKGQSFLGPLPDQMEFVWYRNQGLQSPEFRNKITGLVVFDDPRLPALSDEWRRVGEPHRAGFESLVTDERRGWREDPRCDVEALEARGVKLDTFPLV